MLKILRLLLAPLSLLWRVVAVVRNLCFDRGWLPSRHFNLPVISVGNLSVGGTGKTPHVEGILSHLCEAGFRVAVLSRGYGRRTKGFLLVTPEAGQTPYDVGDEPYQIKRAFPKVLVAVCERRVVGIERLLSLPHPPEAIILDDAYQHRYVTPSLSILLTEADNLYTHDHLLPWGRLREPAFGARRADLIVVTKCRDAERPRLRVGESQTLYYSHIVYGVPHLAGDTTQRLMSLAGRSILLVTGIANPRPLNDHLQRCGASCVRSLRFPDHHYFTSRDVAAVCRAWSELVSHDPEALLLTTAKDVVRLEAIASRLSPQMVQHLYVQPIVVSVDPADKTDPPFFKYIVDYVTANSRNRRMD